MADDNQTPIAISSSPAADNPGAAGRDIMIIIGVLPALVAVFGTRDTMQIVSYVASVQFAPALGVLLTAGAVVWRQIITWRKQRAAIDMAHSADDKVAVVRPSFWCRLKALFS